jgi:hypothetical protein
LSYDRDDSVTAFLSARCQIRVLWGGDESVRNIRAIPLNPLAIELPFADRYALAALDALKVATASEERHRKLISDFYNDCYWFDQLACSSPRLVVWVGDSESCDQAKRRFWPALEEFVEGKHSEYPEIVGINKLNALYAAAAHGSVDVISAPTTTVARAHLTGVSDAYRELHCGGGMFFEYEAAELNDIAQMLEAKDQTICHYEFSQTQIRNLLTRLPQRAVDRIVPIGSGLQFNTTWDGIDLLDAFSRKIAIC